MLRAAAGHPSQLQIMYGLSGERRLHETTLHWLSGYEGSQPVRVGNAAYDQLQIDVYGELMDALHVGRKFQLEPSQEAWKFQRVLLENLKRKWSRPDKGIWEVRSGAKHFTHSKLMAWVAYDRGVKGVEDSASPARWRNGRRSATRSEEEILEHGWSDKRKSFVQTYGGEALDAALLIMPTRRLPAGGRSARRLDGRGDPARPDRGRPASSLPHRRRRRTASPDERARSSSARFWLADALAMIGRHDEATELFERLLSLRNDLGLLAEEYDPREKTPARQLPAGLFACRPGQHGEQPRSRPRPGAAARRGSAARRAAGRGRGLPADAPSSTIAARRRLPRRPGRA